MSNLPHNPLPQGVRLEWLRPQRDVKIIAGRITVSFLMDDKLIESLLPQKALDAPKGVTINNGLFTWLDVQRVPPGGSRLDIAQYFNDDGKRAAHDVGWTLYRMELLGLPTTKLEFELIVWYSRQTWELLKYNMGEAAARGMFEQFYRQLTSNDVDPKVIDIFTGAGGFTK